MGGALVRPPHDLRIALRVNVSRLVIVMPPASMIAGISRLRLQPQATRRCTPLRRSCHFRTLLSGARPCSAKWNVPPGRTRARSRAPRHERRECCTRSTSRVQRRRTRHRARGSDRRDPRNRPPHDCRTVRARARWRPLSSGSTAKRRLTEAGSCGRLSPLPNPISSTSPSSG